jgi:hypothetical protein
MSIQRLDPSALPLDPGGSAEGFESALISRLANEIFSQGAGAFDAPPAPVSVPQAVAGVPSDGPAGAANPIEPAASPGGGRDIGLSGGFPSSSSPSAPPPVHPTVVGAEPEAVEKSEQPPTGTHRPGSKDSHEFGEPSFYTKGLGTSAPSKASNAHAGSVPEDIATPDFYFLKDIPGFNVLPSFGGRPSSSAVLLPEFDVEGVR